MIKIKIDINKAPSLFIKTYNHETGEKRVTENVKERFKWVEEGCGCVVGYKNKSKNKHEIKYIDNINYVRRTFSGIDLWFMNHHDIDGLVFFLDNDNYCKVTRKHFGL